MATQFFMFFSRDGLRVRTKPVITAATLVQNRKLAFGDILEVKSESRTEASNLVWWEHANTPGLWTASEQIKPPVKYVEDYQPPHDPTPTPPDTSTGDTSSGTTTPPDTSPPTDTPAPIFSAVLWDKL